MKESRWKKSQRKITFQFAGNKGPEAEITYQRLHRSQELKSAPGVDKTSDPSVAFLQERFHVQPVFPLSAEALPVSSPSGPRETKSMETAI